MARRIQLHLDEVSSAPASYANAGSAGGTWAPSATPPTGGVAGFINKAIDCIGDGQYRSISGGAAIEPASVTLWLWVYLTTNGTVCRLVHKEYAASGAWNSPYNSIGVALTTTGLPVFYVATGGTLHSTNGTWALPLNQWHQLCLTYDGTNLTGYLDGIQVGQLAVSAAIDYGTHGTWRAGATVNAGDGSQQPGFAGRLDEINLEDVAFTPAQVLAQYRVECGSSVPPPVKSGPILSPPPLTTPMLAGGIVSSVWARWLQQLRDAAAS